MADYSREIRRFFYTGLSLVPQDALAEGKSAYVRNIRSYQPGTWTPRNGNHEDNSSPMTGPLHSGARLNDTTQYADIGAPARRFVGAAHDVLVTTPGSGTYAIIDSGYSGNPLSLVAASPVNSPRPFMYVGDSDRQRKINSSLNDMTVGLATPIPPPTALFAPIQYTESNPIDDNEWVDYGVSTGTAVVERLNVGTTISAIVYDDGVIGMASIAASDMTGIVPGCMLTIDESGAGEERVIVQEVHPSVGATTIEAIQYDSGLSGLCTIQPSGSLYTGQIEATIPDEVRRRYQDLNQPVPTRVTVSRTVDFPVNALVTIAAIETVRILSVSVGTDGILSFRCFLGGTYSPGDTIEGVAAFRASTVGTATGGMALTAKAAENTITLGDADIPEVGGVQAQAPAFTFNWGLVGIQATTGNDIIRLGFKASAFGYIQSVRLMLNLTDDDGSGGATFLNNYYLYEWRASDLVNAVQIAIGQATGLMADSQAGAVLQGQVDSAYSDQYGQQTTKDDPLGRPTHDPVRAENGKLIGRTGAQIRSWRDRVDSYVQVGSVSSRQISLGDDQWVWLQCRVQDLTRIGTDVTKNLSAINAAAMTVQVGGTTDPITVSFGDLYLTGGYGPDVGQTLTPYVYRYRYRSTITGERSNPSPPMRGGIAPQRGRIVLTGTQSGDPQCDSLDWFRYGGLLSRWTYVGTSDNSTAPFNDDMEDGQIDGGETLNNDLYQPWPTYDLPRSGTCNVAGTAITWASGDTFNVDWGANSIIIVNGRATSLYRQPESTTVAQLVDNCGSGTVEFQVPGADLLGVPLPYQWAGPLNGTWFTFACGDPSDPSLLHWSHGNDPDATSPNNTVVVSTGSAPLYNGFFDDGVPYVFSTEHLYRLEQYVSPNGNPAFVARETQCTQGLWAPWAFVVLPNGGGVIFLAKDGFYLSRGGGDAQSISNPDLKILFPQDGTRSQAIRGLYPVDMTQTTRLRLAIVDGIVYFDYVDTQGEAQTLLCEPAEGFRWSYDRYDMAQVVFRWSEPGPQVHDHLIGTVPGTVYISSLDDITDNRIAVDWEYDTNWDTGGNDPRATKQFGDSVLNFNPGGSFNGVEVTPVIAHGNTALPLNLLGQGDTLRKTYIVENNAGQGNAWSPDYGLKIHGVCEVCDSNRPLFYYWEPAWVHKQTIIHLRATDYENLGYVGAKFVQGVVMRANTYGSQKLVAVEYDNDIIALTLGATHNGDRQIAYPNDANGWTPFIAELVRLKGQDELDWNLLDWRWVWEPAPELATQWETQDTTFDNPGFLSVHDVVMAYSAPADVTLTVWHDANAVQYTLPATGGVYVRDYTILQAQKGKSARFRLTSDEPFRVFKRDCSMRVQGWGVPGGFVVQNPFGGPHRLDGAAI